jgi:phosphatidylglycerophosphate synthase
VTVPSSTFRLPDQLTALRLIATPILWVLALLHLRTALGIGLALAGLTDVLDGFFARRMHRTTRTGSQLDSIADMTLIISIVIWLFMLRPDLFRDYGPILAIWSCLGVLTLLVGWIKFRRFGNLHLYSAKAAGVIGYCFALYMLMLDRPAAPFFWIAIGAAFLATTESLLVLLFRSRVDEAAGTLLRSSRRRDPQA